MTEEYQDQNHDSERICPYCKTGYQVDDENYSKDEGVEKCEGGGMYYHFTIEYTVDHNTSPDCKLNGKDHNFGDPIHHQGITFSICEVCQQSKRL